jgi:NAD(P)-dependent dehydrogenase (short-subunit alcohol dehydrogenase family)
MSRPLPTAGASASPDTGHRLGHRVALVTGAGQGIGRGIALALAAEGARVAVVGRTRAKCEAVAAEIGQRGGRALALECDVEHRPDVDAAVAATVDELGRVDILVNGAQTLVYQSVRRITEDDLASMWQSGPLGTLRFQQASFEQLRANRGCVINLGSGSSLLPAPAMSGYAMVKEAIRVLTRVTALEWGRYGIRVNAICPLAETPGWRSFLDQLPGADDVVLPNIPLGRFGDPEHDIGRAAVYLASDDAAYVTGTTLMVDGGYSHLR